MMSAERRPASEMDLAALHRLKAAVVLTFDQSGSSPPRNLRFERLGEGVREQEMIVRVDRSLPEAAGGNRLVTFNGRSWDIPMMMQRAAASWCFSASRIAAWSEAPIDLHFDMMR